MADETAATAPEAERPNPLWTAIQLLSIALVTALLVLLAWRLITAEAGGSFVAGVRAGERPPAPAFTLPVLWDATETWPVDVRPALDDGHVALAELGGYPVVINFWASWCDPCKEEAPLLSDAAAKNRGRVVFLGLNVQDFESDARDFLERYGANNYVSVRDSSNDVYEAYGLTGVPETFYLDADGRVVVHSRGQLTEQELSDGVSAIAGGES